jgi:hypothetical protein
MISFASAHTNAGRTVHPAKTANTSSQNIRVILPDEVENKALGAGRATSGNRAPKCLGEGAVQRGAESTTGASF